MTPIEVRMQGRDVMAARGRLRNAVRAGRLTIADLLAQSPPEIQTMTLLDVLGLARAARSGLWMAGIGEAALRSGVNVLHDVRDATPYELAWASAHAPRPYARTVMALAAADAGRVVA